MKTTEAGGVSGYDAGKKIESLHLLSTAGFAPGAGAGVIASADRSLHDMPHPPDRREPVPASGPGGQAADR